jgi:glyoxalase-like protein
MVTPEANPVRLATERKTGLEPAIGSRALRPSTSATAGWTCCAALRRGRVAPVNTSLTTSSLSGKGRLAAAGAPTADIRSGAMRFYLDHVIVAVRDLERAVKDWESIGLIATDGGAHPKVGTRNALVRFPDRSFLELMAIDDREKLHAYAPVLLALLERHADRPFSWSLRTDDIEAARQALAERGFQMLPIWPGEALRDSGKIARWRTLHIQEAGFPFLVQYEAEPTSPPSTKGLPVIGLGAVLLSGPPVLMARLAQAFGARADEGHVRFDGGGAFLQPNASSESTIAGVEILVRDMKKAERLLGDIDLLAGAVDADHRLHGLSLRLSSA